MMQTRLLTVMAVIEAATGLLLLAVPGRVLRLLLGEGAMQLPVWATAMLGAGLLPLGVLVWTGRHGTATGWRFRTMLAYNGLAAAGLAALALAGWYVGPLLWPTVMLHAALLALQLGALQSDRARTKGRT